MALPQVVTKTYSRRRSRQADPVSHAERTFDELFRDTSRPPARAAATAEKWGSASFKRVANVTRTSPKRRLSPTHDADDPFSFDSDDDNIAKKSRKENVQRTVTSPRKPIVDGEISAAEKLRSQTMNFKTEKSSADGVADKQKLTRSHDERRTKQFIEKMRVKCQPAVKSGDSERNGMSVYRMSASAVSGRGDSLDTNDRKCRTNGLEARDQKSSCSPTSGRNTRSSGTPSPCKTTEQLKVFVDNFSQLLSSQRSSSGKHYQLDSDISIRTQSSSAELDSPVKKSKISENCDIDVGNSHLRRAARDSRQAGSSVKTKTSLSSPSHRSKQLHQCIDVDSDDDDDDDVVLLLSPNVLPSTRSSHRLGGDSGTASSGTCSQDTSSSRNSLRTKTTRDVSRLKCSAGSGSSKNEAVGSRSSQSRSHRWQASGSGDSELGTTTTPAAATTTTTTTATTTRRLLTGSQKVSSMSLVCVTLNIDEISIVV